MMRLIATRAALTGDMLLTDWRCDCLGGNSCACVCHALAACSWTTFAWSTLGSDDNKLGFCGWRVRVCVIICRIKFILVVVASGSMQDNGCLSGGGFTCPPPQSESGCVTHTHSRKRGLIRLFHCCHHKKDIKQNSGTIWKSSHINVLWFYSRITVVHIVFWL